MIWKYNLPQQRTATIMVPRGARFRHIDWQGVRPTLWYEVDSSSDLEARAVRCYGTGELLPTRAGTYLGTLHEENLVWHFYEASE